MSSSKNTGDRKQYHIATLVDDGRLSLAITMHFDVTPEFTDHDKSNLVEDVTEIMEKTFTQNRLKNITRHIRGCKPIPESEGERKRKFDTYWFKPFASKFKYPTVLPPGLKLRDWCETPADACGDRGPITQVDGRDEWACRCGRTFATTEQGTMPVVRRNPDGTWGEDLEFFIVEPKPPAPASQDKKAKRK